MHLPTPLLAFLVHLNKPTAGSHAEHTEAMDLFVLATLGTLFFLLGCFATWGWLIWRRGQNPAPHVKLLMELEEEEARQKQRPPGPNPAPAGTAEEERESPPPPWERSADWWKKPS